MNELAYGGSELNLFRDVHHWKGYFREQLAQYIHGNVLEVGAGIGGTTRAIFSPACRSWTCLEPDPQLVSELRGAVAELCDTSGRPPMVRTGTVATLGASDRFDCVLYIDTLEHIEADRAELSRAVQHVASGGYLVVLSPAHQWLYTAFDRAIGHYRRYTLTTLRACAPANLELVSGRYLDSVGIAASLANRMLLRSAMPTARQLAIWDRWMVPLSRRLDPLLRYTAGKSVLCAWKRPATPPKATTAAAGFMR